MESREEESEEVRTSLNMLMVRRPRNRGVRFNTCLVGNAENMIYYTVSHAKKNCVYSV